MINTVTVIIRSIGERTENLCYKYVLREVSKENVFLINERPFREAVIKGFRIGLNRGTKWTLAIDADIILKENAISEMIAKFETLSEKYFLYQGCVFDKFYNNFRSGGPHLYRTELLKELINFVPEDGESLRPESDSFYGLINKGYHYYNDNKLFGLHDFEQSYFDIYRKFFLHAKKHKSSIPVFLNKFKKKITLDNDYQIANRGISDGLLYKNKLFVDVDFFKEKYKTFSVLQLVEKSTLIDEKKIITFFLKINISSLKSMPIRDSSKKKRKQSLTTRLVKRFIMKIYNKSEEYLY